MEIYPNHTLIIQIFSFLFLLFLLNLILYRPIRRIIKRRKEDMSSSENFIQSWRQKAEKCTQEFEENILETRKQGLAQKEDMKDEGIKEEREMLQETYASVEDKIGRARQEIQDSISMARQSLQTEIEAFSQELAEKILGRGV
jgi:F-type H+-transporting ATPase subunit b